MGPLYIESGEWKKAENVYRNLLKYTGGAGDSELLAETYACLGTIEWALEKRDKARQRFSKALAVQENNITALMGMGEVYYDEEDWSKLLNAYNSVIRFAHDPKSVIQAYLIKGHVLDVKMGLPDKAAQHYQKAKHYQETLSGEVKRPAQLERLAELALLKLSELALRENKSEVAKGLIEKALGKDDGFIGLMSNGTSGDINNISFRVPRPRQKLMQRMNEVAQLVADRVLAAHFALRLEEVAG